MIQFRDVTIHSLAKKKYSPRSPNYFQMINLVTLLVKVVQESRRYSKRFFGEVPVASGEIILNDEELNYDTLPDTLSNRRKIGFYFSGFSID